MKKIFVLFLFIGINTINLLAQNQETGTIKGVIIENSSTKSLEFANVILKNTKDSSFFQGTITDKNGIFEFTKIPLGEYKIYYSFIGFDNMESPLIILNDKQNKKDLGKLFITETSRNLNEVEINGQKSTFVNSIDRKTFYVGQDLMSKTGSVSELLQNVPSIVVDIEGNVALRGSSNVMILINGKPSAMMGANRAAVLQQMPANTIEKIEIITNPSAKYKPDGTSGIINIVLKKNKKLGFNGAVSANAGNNNRYNGNILANYNTGKINLYGNYSIRQDDRLRLTDVYRKRIKLNTDTINFFNQKTTDHTRPLSHYINTGIDYKINDHNKIGVSGNYDYRSLIKKATNTNTYQNSDLSISKKYDRLRYDPEFEDEYELSAFLQHTFAKEGHELNVDYTSSRSIEQEDNHYTNVYLIPEKQSSYDNTLIKQDDLQSEFSLEYILPINEDINFESGYKLESQTKDMDYFGEFLDLTSNNWIKDIEKSNRFIYTQNIHVLYSTYEQELDKFGFLLGIRAEQAYINANQVTTDTNLKNNYFRIYPSLHLSYNISKIHELQFNYSHRIHRPEDDDLNPFPEYQDPFNLRIGNPYLNPADVHSIEFGYQFQQKKTTFLSTLYYRYTYNGITDITKYINDSIKLSTKENLLKNNSAGLELIYSTEIGNFATINLSTNTFYNTIDATNLGYSENKSIIAWSANLSSGFNITKKSVLQLSSNYSAERLTPQGKQLPSYVLNIGFKQEVLKKKGSFILTVSDLFNSLRENTIIDIPELYEKTIRKRSGRMIYLGFSYSFGNTNKKENSLKFDNQL